MKNRLLAAALSISPALAPGASLAGGFALDAQDARALGAAMAGAQARRGDAGFGFYNPASLAGGPAFDASLSLTGLIVDSAYENASAQLLGAFPAPGVSAGDGVLSDAVLPNLALAARLTDRIHVGLTVNAPFGFETTYGSDSAIRYHALETDLKTIAATPMVAIELSPFASIGGGVRIQYLDLGVSAAIDAAGIVTASQLGAFIPGTADVFVDVRADDVAIGFVGGFQIQPAAFVTLGASYTSKIEHELNGVAEFDLAGSAPGQALAGLAGLFQNGPASAAFITPASLQFGAEIEVSDRLSVLASVVHTRWAAFEDVTVEFDNPAQPTEVLTQDWRNTVAFSLGAEYDLSPRTSLRAGFMIDETPVRDEFASPRIPDSDRTWLTAGLSHDISDRLSLDFGAAVIFLDERPINLSGAQFENLTRGDLEATVNATAYLASMKLRYAFR